MSPPPAAAKSKRLAELEPAEIATAIVELVREQIANLIRRLDPCAMLPAFDGPPELRLTAEMLTSYAQRGLSATDLDWQDDTCAIDAIQSVCGALYSCAGEPSSGVGPLGRATGDDLDDPVRLVLVAAHARYQLACRGSSVSAVELAALAGLSDDHVRLLARKGELSLGDGAVPRAEARRWLGARGVRGF